MINVTLKGGTVKEYENGITAGKSATSFAPDDPCTRGQVVTFLYNALAE